MNHTMGEARMTYDLTPVQQFHEHLNNGRAAEVMALATQDVAIGGPRGSGHGQQLLFEWVGHASITMQPMRWFARGNVVVVEQMAEWRAPNGSDGASSQRLATAFTVQEGKIAGIYRYGNIGEALTTSGLDETDEITAPQSDR
jgi:hypothetical protein